MKRAISILVMVLMLTQVFMINTVSAAGYKKVYKEKVDDFAWTKTTYYSYMKLTNSKTPDLIIRQNIKKNAYGTKTKFVRVCIFKYKKGKAVKVKKYDFDIQSKISLRKGKRKLVVSGKSNMGRERHWNVITGKNGKVKFKRYRRFLAAGEATGLYDKSNFKMSKMKWVKKSEVKSAIKTKKKLKLRKRNVL